VSIPIEAAAGAGGAIHFVLSALKLPSGDRQLLPPHRNGLGAILFGPVVLGCTMLRIRVPAVYRRCCWPMAAPYNPWGANMFSMAIVGPLVALAWVPQPSFNRNTRLAVFAAAALADLAT